LIRFFIKNLSGSVMTHLSPHPRAAAPTGAAILLDTLATCGVDTVFGYPGGAVLPLYDALQQEPRLRHVLVRHEQAAVHAAEGYARATGRIGVVFVTSGPGVANTVSGLLDALSDAIPILCISGQVATASIGTNAFQECDALGISRTVTKWNVQLRHPEEVATAGGMAAAAGPAAGAGGLASMPVMHAACTSFGKSTRTGPGLPVPAMCRALRTVVATSSG
jgi:2-succinyl-5-enolpyruvyl-6-hydroxy-3-cyclohexene-1-carboxylate synthase